MQDPSIVDLDLKKYVNVCEKLNEQIQTSIQTIQKLMKGFNQECSGEHQQTFLTWRNYILAQYNMELIKLLRFRTQPTQSVTELKKQVDALLLLQLKLSKLLTLESSQRDQLSALIRAASQEQKRDAAPKISKQAALFDDNDDEAPQILREEPNKQAADVLHGIKADRDQRANSKLWTGTTADELFQEQVDLPREYRTGAVVGKEIEELENENMKRLSKAKKKQLTKKAQVDNEDGMFEGDILDGIAEEPKPKKRIYGKDKK